MGARHRHHDRVEGFFSIFKRGMKGVYRHCDERHLHRYPAELDFRCNNSVKLGVSDAERAEMVIKGIAWRRASASRRPG